MKIIVNKFEMTKDFRGVSIAIIPYFSFVITREKTKETFFVINFGFLLWKYLGVVKHG